MKGSFVFLGTSASAGIPIIGCNCSVCTSSSSKNMRLRPSGLLKLGEKKILIDVGPDFRFQALREELVDLDGLILTHTHYDHIAGVDELRIYYLRSGRSLPCLLSIESMEDLKNRYDYLFRKVGDGPTLSAQLDLQILDNDVGVTNFLGFAFQYVTYSQGGTKVKGYRIGDFAYISDIREYDPSIFDPLCGVKTLVLSALSEDPSPLHLSIEEAVAFSKKVGASKTRITHISHALDHEKTNQKLPSGIELGFDGLELEFEI